MNMTRGFSALFAAAIFALPATASAQWAPSPTVIIINSSPVGGWGPGVAPTGPGVGVVVGAAVVVRVGAAVAVAVVVLG